MLGIARADDVAPLQLVHVTAEVVAVATISTLGVRVGALALLRRQLTDRAVAWARARTSSLCNCSACAPYWRPIEDIAKMNVQVTRHERPEVRTALIDCTRAYLYA